MKLRDGDKDYDNDNDDGDGNGWNWPSNAGARTTDNRRRVKSAARAAARNLPMGCGQWTHGGRTRSQTDAETEGQTETTDTFIANHFQCCK